MKKIHFDTDRGEIVAELYDDDAPETVANFVGLATGEKEWTDPKTGQKQKGKPYFDGLRFHRVVANFVIQGGDPFTR
jgi:peptidyl-prolyl cis-trans isomerase A (cyclophilin A)